ncbi:polysaccharide biosynthesis/export family protein [Horticoccus luteus]|uniref:Polysaccharide biosynthesis/export family protein n=1 Tax=Horticoccus luteus TaxID=2862869 RepID=A0A8F9XIK3_9BACT|nr:polysaccharide biosynthesis/export family protein [Horticoccus luteus]QYM77678.1 polysaccharide biosynthesis/export family protein [Horticoccus luteus]
MVAFLAVLLSSFVLRSVATAQPTETKNYDYKLTPTDRVRIAIFQEEDLSTIARIDAKGCVNLPLVGEVRLAGMTRTDAQLAIEKAYHDGRFLRTPQVTITVEDYAPREVSISGAVNSPGRYPLPIESSMSVLELITRAGGFRDTAKGTAVRVTRISPGDNNTDQKSQTFIIDVESLIKGKDRSKLKENALMLEAGDVVYVPERII